jgi:hypothetical protein
MNIIGDLRVLFTGLSIFSAALYFKLILKDNYYKDFHIKKGFFIFGILIAYLKTKIFIFLQKRRII